MGIIHFSAAHLTRLVSERGSRMGLSQRDAAQEDDVGFTVDELQIACRDTPAIREQREQLRTYNDFVKQHAITVIGFPRPSVDWKTG